MKRALLISLLASLAAWRLLVMPSAISATVADNRMSKMSESKSQNWLSRWETNIIRENPLHYCTTEMGEEIGWRMSPFLNGFYHGYLATGDVKWIDKLASCTDAWRNRVVKEPDGYLGWPKFGAAGTDVDDLDSYYADSMLGEAMALAPIVLTANEILKTPALNVKFGLKAAEYIRLSEQTFEKWDTRGAWRESSGGGMITVELPFGIDQKTQKWTSGYETRNAPGSGFSHQDNKANLIACWLLSMFDATQNPIYRERAEKWFRLMKSRMKLQHDGTFEIWNYWEPAGAWDYRPNGIPKHWIGVHPNPGYYGIDVQAIVSAFEHGLIFNPDDINHLVATALRERRYWTALVPYDPTIQRHFEDTHNPSSWDGLQRTPWYISLESRNGLRK